MVWIISYTLFLFHQKIWKIPRCQTVMCVFFEKWELIPHRNWKSRYTEVAIPFWISAPSYWGSEQTFVSGWAASWGCLAADRQHCHHLDRKLLGSPSISCPLVPLWKLPSWMFPVVNTAVGMRERSRLSQSHQMGWEMFSTFKITKKWGSEAQRRVKLYLLDVIHLNYITLHWSNCKSPPISRWIQIFSVLLFHHLN